MLPSTSCSSCSHNRPEIPSADHPTWWGLRALRRFDAPVHDRVMTAITPTIVVPTRNQRVAEAAAPAKAAPVADRPDFRSIYTSTILAVSLAFLFGVGLPAAMVYGNTTGWALGAFCAFWGGPSFGVMAASARVSAWYEKHDKEF